MIVRDLFQEEAEKLNIPVPSEEEMGYVLWNLTGYPGFWNIPEDGATPEECLRKQVREAFQSKRIPGACSSTG